MQKIPRLPEAVTHLNDLPLELLPGEHAGFVVGQRGSPTDPGKTNLSGLRECARIHRELSRFGDGMAK